MVAQRLIWSLKRLNSGREVLTDRYISIFDIPAWERKIDITTKEFEVNPYH